MLSTVNGALSPRGLAAFFCLRRLRAGSVCSLIRIDDLRVSESSRPLFSRCGFGFLEVFSALRSSNSEPEVLFNESLE